MALIEHFEFITKLLREIEELRIKDEPANHLALIFKEGHDQAIDQALNALRKEL